MNILLPLALCLLLPTAADALVIKGAARWQGERTFAEMVRVDTGATLVIEPGTTVTFSAGGLEVAGRLEADRASFTGRNWAGIVLKGTGGDTRLTDCTVDGATTGILVIGGAPRLERLTLSGNQTGIELRQKTAAVLRDSLFQGNAKVGLFVKDGATPTVAGCRFEQNGKFGAYLYRSMPQSFAGNRFTGNATGLIVSHFGSDAKIVGNTFEKNETGILVDRAAKPVLTGNLLRGNGSGLRLNRRADPLVEGNRLQENKVGIAVAFSSYPRLRGNDLSGNEIALLLEFQSAQWEQEEGAASRQAEAAHGAFGQTPRQAVSETDRRPRALTAAVDARENWWGEAGTKELIQIGAEGNPSFIRDGRDTPTFIEGGKSYPLDKALFAPWSPRPRTEGKVH